MCYVSHEIHYDNGRLSRLRVNGFDEGPLSGREHGISNKHQAIPIAIRIRQYR